MRIEYAAADPIPDMPQLLVPRWGNPATYNVRAVIRKPYADVAFAEFSSEEAASLCMIALMHMTRTLFVSPAKEALVALVAAPWLTSAEITFFVEEADSEFLIRATQELKSLTVGACHSREVAQQVAERLASAARIRLPF
jgi:hypothetical protein